MITQRKSWLVRHEEAIGTRIMLVITYFLAVFAIVAAAVCISQLLYGVM